MALYANVIIDISHEKLDKTFQYKIPKALQEGLSVGMQVEVPFGSGERKSTGYVVELTDTPEYRFQCLIHGGAVIFPNPPCKGDQLRFNGNTSLHNSSNLF